MSTPVYFRAPEKLLLELGIARPDEIDVEAIAQYCGATVIYEGLRGCAARILGVDDRAIISVNGDSSRGRQRFSVAHELGHWMYDRGKASFACDENMMAWSPLNPEQRANEYAGNLLLPVGMFTPLAKNKPITFETVRALAEEFQTSLTATTIRIVRHGSFPALVTCNSHQGRVWFQRGPDVPEVLWPTEKPGSSTVAYDVLRGDVPPGKATDVKASAWFDSADAAKYWVKEDVVKIGHDLVLSLLWWEDEQQLVDLETDEPDTGLDLRFR